MYILLYITILILKKMSNENEYLILCNELKEQYKELEKQKIKLNEELIFFKKEFLTTYGFIRLIDNLISKEPVLNNTLTENIEFLRSHQSEIFEEKILCIKKDDEEEDEIEELNITFQLS
jgi:hypothetical protein